MGVGNQERVRGEDAASVELAVEDESRLGLEGGVAAEAKLDGRRESVAVRVEAEASGGGVEPVAEASPIAQMCSRTGSRSITSSVAAAAARESVSPA